jgi:hypothetical protein
MIAEQLIDNQPMILGAPDKRSYYETAALIVALWADNLESLTDKLITEFHSLSKEDKIAKLMRDPRYFNRFRWVLNISYGKRTSCFTGMEMAGVAWIF